MVFRRTKEGCRQRWRLRIPNYSRKMVKFSNKVQNSRRRPSNQQAAERATNTEGETG